ncbi:MAG TPA: DEAD/DEAH box helicase, partial [Cytophagaceae bacterium]
MGATNSNILFNEEGNLFADVILPLHLPKPFTYRIGESFRDKISIGSRVLVEFGKKKILTGIVNNIHETIPENYSPKLILEVLEENPFINEKQLKLFHWMAGYYMCSAGEVINAALPAGLKLSSNSKIKLNPLYKEMSGQENLATDEEKLIHVLERKQSLTYDEISDLFSKRQTSILIKSLLSKNYIILFEEVTERYSSRVIRKIRLNSSIFNNESEIESLFKQLEKKELQINALLSYLRHVPLHSKLNELGLTKSILIKEKVSPSALSTLTKKNIFEEFLQPISRFENVSVTKGLPILTEFQTKAKQEIGECFKTKETVLLHGITGSGKTEIYINLINEALNGGSQVLYLLPEIAITTQLVERLKVYFGEKMGVYHSKFSDNERVEVWHEILSGKLSFIVGVRSSVFLPFDNLGLIIIDEEHEYSFKQYD